jgi:hypothetical protein
VSKFTAGTFEVGEAGEVTGDEVLPLEGAAELPGDEELLAGD